MNPKQSEHVCDRFDLALGGARLAGRSNRLPCGLIFHRISLQASKRESLIGQFPPHAIWIGAVLNGSVRATLPDLGLKTLRPNDWFITRLDQATFHFAPGIGASLFIYSFCGGTMRHLRGLADDEPLRENLAQFSTREQALPAIISGSGSTALNMLTLDTASARNSAEMNALSLEWMKEFFRQPDLINAKTEDFGPILSLN